MLSSQTDRQTALNAIRKKLIGKILSYKEIYSIMDQIANQRLGDVLTTYFTASGYSQGFTNQELYFLTKAMVETGRKLCQWPIARDSQYLRCDRQTDHSKLL